MPSPIRLQSPTPVCAAARICAPNRRIDALRRLAAVPVRVAVLICGLLSATTHAHHAFVAVYNPAETRTIEGSFAGLELVNPHARVYIDVTAEDGGVEQWTVEAAGKLSLARRGWTDGMFRQGEVITAVGHPALSGDNAMWMVRIVKSDGSEYFAPNVEDANAIEAERRERARRAGQQQ